MKKEVSDKIAQAFFENKQKKKKQNQKSILIFWIIFLSCFCLFFLVSSLRRQAASKNKKVSSGSIIFEKSDGPYILNFDFSKNDSKRMSLSIEMGDVDLTQYSLLKFRVKLSGVDNVGKNLLKICLINLRQEAACIYIGKIGAHWNHVVVNLSDFQKMHDWVHLKNLVFTLEEWNLAAERGELFIDEIEFCTEVKK